MTKNNYLINLEFQGKNYFIEDNFHLEELLFELLVLQAVSKSNNYEELKQNLDKELSIVPFEEMQHVKDIDNKKVKLVIYDKEYNIIDKFKIKKIDVLNYIDKLGGEGHIDTYSGENCLNGDEEVHYVLSTPIPETLLELSTLQRKRDEINERVLKLTDDQDNLKQNKAELNILIDESIAFTEKIKKYREDNNL